jgi:glycosyltransferase involved in cell wall biosynthesis
MLGELGLREKLVFLYAGNMGHPNDMESIVASADTLRERNDLHFVFLGTGAKRRWLEDRVRSLALPNVTVLDPRPRSEQMDFLNACDVAIVSLVSKMVGVSMPSRTYNILAAGKPILALTEEGSEVARVVAEEGIGWITPPLRPDELTSTILHILESRDRLPGMGAAAREVALRSYSLDVALEKYRREL